MDKDTDKKKKAASADKPASKKKTPQSGHTGRLGGSRQGNAGMEEASEGAHR